MPVAANILNADLKTFVEENIKEVCCQIGADARPTLPKHPEFFIQKIMKDKNGGYYKNEAVHNAMHQFRRRAHRNGFKKILVLGLFGHGKSEQLCIGLCLYLIAKDPNIRIKIVHVSDDEATNRVRAIKDYIDKDEDFKNICPHVIPTNIWGSKKLFVKRDFTSKDPTVQAFSVMSASIGGRADVLIFDDPQDYKTAVIEPTTRENIENIFKNIWMSRLATDGDVETIVMMNKWHENDLASFLMKNSMWAWMQIGVNEDKESLFYEDSFGLKRDIPLWSKFGKQELINRHIELGDRDYNRGYRLIAYSDSDKTFPNFAKCIQYGVKPIRLIDDPRDWIFVGGVDFSGAQRPGTALTILAVHRQTGKKIPVELRAYSGSIGLAEGLVETWRQYGIELFKAENNATQSAIIDMLTTKLGEREFQKYNIKIEGFQTGRNKADPLVGLPAIQKEMENNEWIFCFDRQFTTDDDPEKNLWYRFYLEMLNHPFYVTSDFTMSLWFARACAIDLIRTGKGPNIY
jgi:hypothetical protein